MISGRIYSMCFIISISCFVCDAFFARTGKDGNYRTRSHRDITNIGTMQAIDKYIKETKAIISLNDFFGDDHLALTSLIKKVTKLAQAVSDTQADKKETAYMHCHANQIKLAHSFVKSCRQRILQVKSDEETSMEQIGQCLYTIQSFYSNTNWVEMFGAVVYEDFGIHDLMEVADNENTCEDRGNFDSQCKDNILVNQQNKLTSGYHHARGNIKPTESVEATRGKCSHGGPDDESRKQVARCGINKDSVTEKWSPHNYLHKEAYTAAIFATVHFLVGNGTGALTYLGDKAFESMFHIKKRTDKTLAIAIDYTSSMTEDIGAVKETVIKFLTETVGSDNEPADYVLSLIHDPSSWLHVFTYTDGYEMIKKVKSLEAIGGVNPDCPELSAAGMINAIDKSRVGSPLLVFTDAPAKDANRIDEVITAAKTKNISISPLLSDQCGRKRSVRGRTKRSVSFYQQIAEATGGTLHETDKTNIGNVIEEVIKELFPSNEVIIHIFRMPSTLTESEFIVDSTVVVLKITVSGALSTADVELVYPDGCVEDFTSGKSTHLFTSGQAIISVQHPPVGVCKVVRKSAGDWIVNVTAQSNIKFDPELLEVLQNGDEVKVHGNPVKGNNYSVSLNIYNLNNNSSCDSIVLTDQSGEVLQIYKATEMRRQFDILCFTKIDLPNLGFYVQLNGTDNNGYSFTRRTGTLYKPTSVQLLLEASTDDVIIGKERNIGFVVTNMGVATETYHVTIRYSHNFVTGSDSVDVNVRSEESANGSFIIKPTTSSVIISYTVAVSIVPSSDIQQSVTRKLVVTAIERPDCMVVSAHGRCGPESLNTANCSLYTWKSEATVTYSGTTLETVSSTVGDAVQLIYDNITGVSSGPIQINVSGDCCSPDLQVNIIDVDGFISQCHLSFSDGSVVQSVEVSSTPVDKENLDYIVIIVTMSLCVIVVIVSVSIAVVFHQIQQKTKHAIYKATAKPDNAQNHRFNIKHLNKQVKGGTF